MKQGGAENDRRQPGAMNAGLAVCAEMAGTVPEGMA